MTKVKYKINFKEPEIVIKDLRRLVTEVLYKFNGNSILSNVSINVIGINRFEVICRDEFLFIVHGAFCLVGKLMNHYCCFEEAP